MKLEKGLDEILARDFTLKAAADAYLAWKVKERNRADLAAKKAGTYSRCLIPGYEYLCVLQDKEELLKILESNPESLLEYLKRPKKAPKAKAERKRPAPRKRKKR